MRRQQADAMSRKVGLWIDCDARAAELAGDGAGVARVDYESQFEPLAGSEFEYGRIAARAVVGSTAARDESLANPGDTRDCSSFEYFEDSNQWFYKYFPLYGDVAKLDGDRDGVPCAGLPHTPRRELYQPKTARAEFLLSRVPIEGAVEGAPASR